MQNILEERDRWRKSQQLDADKQHADHNIIATKSEAYWRALSANISADVDAYNAASTAHESLSHLNDPTTGSIGFCRTHPFPAAELWLRPRDNGISCKLEIMRAPEADPEVRHLFLEYMVNQDSELIVRHHGLLLGEDDVMELLLGRLIFPFGRPPAKD